MTKTKTKTKTIAKRGFAGMDAGKQKELARQGGSSVAARKRVFYTNRELAAEAGRKGGKAIKPERRSFSINRELASEAGRKGGIARAKKYPR